MAKARSRIIAATAGLAALGAVTVGAMVPMASAAPAQSHNDPGQAAAEISHLDQMQKVVLPVATTIEAASAATVAEIREVKTVQMKPEIVAGIPNPCSLEHPITDSMPAAEITDLIEQTWGIKMTGDLWRQAQSRDVVKLFAETMDSVDCTDYLNRVHAGNGGQLEVNSGTTRSGWAWGDYGLTRPKVLTLDVAKFNEGYAAGERGRLVRLIIHEMAHTLSTDRGSNPAYWAAYGKVWKSQGPVSEYGSTETESFADAVGYYVSRCAAENPYQSTDKSAYYDYVKEHIFAGREFGGAVGTPQICDIKGR